MCRCQCVCVCAFHRMDQETFGDVMCAEKGAQKKARVKSNRVNYMHKIHSSAIQQYMYMMSER